MIYLIWSVINGIILFYFLYLVIGFIAKGKQFLNTHFRTASTFILVIGLVQIISASNSNENNNNQIIITKDFDKKNNSEIRSVLLESQLTFDINMVVKYSDEQNELVPIESNSFLTGLISGYEWEFKSIITDKLNQDNKAEFVANGILKWKLFGINVYSDAKTFTGTIE